MDVVETGFEPDRPTDPGHRVRQAVDPAPASHWVDGSPFRTPWRVWGEASRFFRQGVDPDWHVDPLVPRTVRFMAAADPAFDEPLWDAFDLATGPPLRRAHLVAYLLTGLPVVDVAARTGHLPEMVGLYAKVFCDVEGRLKARGWVARHLTGGGFATPDDLGALWKVHGYGYGAAALDAVVAASVRLKMVGGQDGWTPPPVKVSRRAMEVARRTVLALTLPQEKTDELALLLRAVKPDEVWFRRAKGVTVFGIKGVGKGSVLRTRRGRVGRG